MCDKNNCEKCKTIHHKHSNKSNKCNKCCEHQKCNKCNNHKNVHHESNKRNRICTNTLNVNNIIPLSHSSTIGCSNKKFNKIYAKELCVDNYDNFMGPRGQKGYTGKKGDTGDSGEQGTKGDVGEQGTKGDVGDAGDAAKSPITTNQNNELSVDTIRDIPCHKLSLLFFNQETKEISYDSNILSYSDLVDLVMSMKTKLDELP